MLVVGDQAPYEDAAVSLYSNKHVHTQIPMIPLTLCVCVH